MNFIYLTSYFDIIDINSYLFIPVYIINIIILSELTEKLIMV